MDRRLGLESVWRERDMLRQLLTLAVVTIGIGLSVAMGSSLTPILGTLVQGASIVPGTAAPGSGPIVIYDMSFPVATKIGTTSGMANDGRFVVAVKPPLVQGHQIIAVDHNGNASTPVTVLEANPNPAPVP
jgi:hypothetical protein